MLLDALRSAWDFVAGSKSEVLEAWAEDEGAFEEHFGVSYEEFNERLKTLDRSQFELYDKTVKSNPEAAVLWIFFITSLE